MDVKIEQISEEERKEIINYGIKRAKVILVSTLVTILIGLILGIFWQSIIFWFSLSSLRKYAGGYHADSEKRCYIISFAVIVLSLISIKQMDCSILIYILTQTLNLLIIFALSPVENDNHRLDNRERKRYGTRTRIIALVLYVVFCTQCFFSVFWIANSIGIANLVVGLSLIAGYIKDKGLVTLIYK